MKTEEIIQRQYRDIVELRHKMHDFLAIDQKEVKALFVGEGVQWTSTFLGFCIINNYVPANFNKILIIDLSYSGDLNFNHQLIFEGHENLNIDTITGDATKMEFNDNEFDMIIAPLMIDDCANHFKLLSEFKRCVKPKGRIILSGHGIDIDTRYRNLPDILGYNHANQTSIESIQTLLKDINANIVYTFNNEHCWLNVFNFIND